MNKSQVEKNYFLPRNGEIRFHMDVTPKKIAGVIGQIEDPGDLIVAFIAPRGHHFSISHIPFQCPPLLLLQALVRGFNFALNDDEQKKINPLYNKLRECINQQQPEYLEQMQLLLMPMTNALNEMESRPWVYLFFREQGFQYHQVMSLLKSQFTYTGGQTDKIRVCHYNSGNVFVRCRPTPSVGEAKSDKPLLELPYDYSFYSLMYALTKRQLGVARLVDVVEVKDQDTQSIVLQEKPIVLGQLCAEFELNAHKLRKDLKDDIMQLLMHTSAIMDRKIFIEAALPRVMPQQSPLTHKHYGDQLKNLTTVMATRRVLAMMRVILPKKVDQTDLLMVMKLFTHVVESLKTYELLDKMMKEPYARSEQMVDPVLAWMQDVFLDLKSSELLKNSELFNLLVPVYQFLERYPELVSQSTDGKLIRKINRRVHLKQFLKQWPMMKVRFIETCFEVDAAELFAMGNRKAIRAPYTPVVKMMDGWRNLGLFAKPVSESRKKCMLGFSVFLKLLGAMFTLWLLYHRVSSIFGFGQSVLAYFGGNHTGSDPKLPRPEL